MDESKKLDPIVVSSCIFLEDESAETAVEIILAKVCRFVFSIEEGLVVGALAKIVIVQTVFKKSGIHCVARIEAHLFITLNDT
jgi:hypothetical protein